MTHDFDDDFNFSNTQSADALVRRACHRLLPGCCGVTRATQEQDRKGVDYWIAFSKGRLGLDLKLRRKDYGATRGAPMDCVIELDGHGSSGWLTKSTVAKLILFACADSGRVAMYETKQLQTAVMLNVSRWIASGKAKEIKTESIRSGRTWTNYAVIVSSELLDLAVEALDDSAWVEAANDWSGTR